jgi:hypothetical protein
MEFSSILETHAQVALGVAGFASVVAALSRPLSHLMRVRFSQLLSNSFIQVFACLVPGWMQIFFDIETQVWQVCSIAFLLFGLSQIWWIVIAGLPENGTVVGYTINRKLTSITWAATIGAFILLGLNASNMAEPPSFEMYYGALLCALLVAFTLFADVVIGKAGQVENAT